MILDLCYEVQWLVFYDTLRFVVFKMFCIFGETCMSIKFKPFIITLLAALLGMIFLIKWSGELARLK